MPRKSRRIHGHPHGHRTEMFLNVHPERLWGTMGWAPSHKRPRGHVSVTWPVVSIMNSAFHLNKKCRNCRFSPSIFLAIFLATFLAIFWFSDRQTIGDLMPHFGPYCQFVSSPGDTETHRSRSFSEAKCDILHFRKIRKSFLGWNQTNLYLKV